MRQQFVDVVLVLAAGLLCAVILIGIWISADGRYTPEPSLVTPQTVAPAVIFEVDP